MAGFSPPRRGGWTGLLAAEVLGVYRRELLPLVRQLILGEAGVHRTCLDTGVAVDALVRIDVELFDVFVVGLVRSRVNAVDRADLDAGVVLLADAGFGDYVSQALVPFPLFVVCGSGVPESRILESVEMILVTGATGTVGRALLPRLLERGEEVRVLVRDPRKLGRMRVEVRIVLGDLTDFDDRRVTRQALRGVDTVIHLAASIRDQEAPVEELNGLATARFLRASEAAGIGRFTFFSAIGATEFQRTRFFRAKALAERAVRESELATTVFAPSIVYDRDDPWVTIMRRLALLPLLPVSGEGKARFEPIWAGDVADCIVADLDRGDGSRRHELAGPEQLDYDAIARVVAAASGRKRPIIHIPLGVVHFGLTWLQRIVGNAAFATWEEVELMEVPMVAANGPADVRALGVEPRRMADVLAG